MRYGALSAGLAIYPLDASGSRGSKRVSAAKTKTLSDSWGGYESLTTYLKKPFNFNIIGEAQDFLRIVVLVYFTKGLYNLNQENCLGSAFAVFRL